VPNPIANPNRPKDIPPQPEEAAALNKFHYQRDSGIHAMSIIKDLHLASNAENAEFDPLPADILQQMTSCHNAANEFLRQYWSAVLPAQAGTLGTKDAGVKAAKAVKMAGYLRGMEGKINAVVHTASIGGMDPARVRAVSLALLG
jgi:transcription initiation factor TFIIH subunit 1